MNRSMTSSLTSPRSRSFLKEQKGLAVEYLAGRRNFRTDLAPAGRTWSPSWDRVGLEKLVLDAMKASKWPLPHNLATHGPWVGFPREGAVWDVYTGSGVNKETGELFLKPHECNIGTASRMVQEAARFSGWLKAASGLNDPMIDRLISRGLSPRGVNSPATKFDLWELSRRFSPGALSRQIRQIKARADQVLAPMGLRVSWGSLGTALAKGPSQTGKAAIFAAALTLGAPEYFTRTYRDARDFLTSVCKTVNTVRDTQDDTEFFVQGGSPDLVRGSIALSRGFVRNPARLSTRTPGVLVENRATGETFHSLETGMREAVRQARLAWDFRTKMDLEREAYSGGLRLSGVSVLVSRQDSYQAGNCRPGTEEFAHRLGWDKRWYVPSTWLWKNENRLAWNAALLAERRMAEVINAQGG